MKTRTNILGLTFSYCLALVAVGLGASAALGQRAGPIEVVTPEPTTIEESVPSGIEVTFLPQELLEGVAWDQLLGDPEILAGSPEEVRIGICRGLGPEVLDGQWHEILGGQVQALDPYAAQTLASALIGTEIELPVDAVFALYLAHSDDPTPDPDQAGAAEVNAANDESDQEQLEQAGNWDGTSQADDMSTGLTLDDPGGRVTAAHGAVPGLGITAEDAAITFVERYAAAFGAEIADLAPADVFGETFLQPLGYDPDTDAYRFTLVRFTQHRDAVPVYGAELRVLVRNEPAWPVVLATSSLRDLGTFRVDADSVARDPSEAAYDSALRVAPDLLNFEPTEYVVWAGADDTPVAPRLGVKFVADNGPEAWQAEKWLFIVDALTAEVLHQVDLVVATNVTGNVSGMATTGTSSDNCVAEQTRSMPYATVRIIGGTSTFTDANGNFTISNGGTSQVTVESPMTGQWFTVDNTAGNEETLTTVVTPPGPATFVHNQANTAEFVRAQVNGYIQANVVRAFVLQYNPSYPTISTQTRFPVNVNRTGGNCPTLAAWYDGTSLNFCRAGAVAAGVPHTAFSGIIHHEYGHHVVAMGGSGLGGYGEGMADSITVLIADDPVIGRGFWGNCGAGVRTADNTCQYSPGNGGSSCGTDVYSQGNVLSGAIWATRNQLRSTNPSTYRQILSRLTVDSIVHHTGTAIRPDITLVLLTHDDNDNSLNNGTPHYTEIATGFGSHGLVAPPINVAAASGNCTYVRISWSSVPSATGYTIWRAPTELGTKTQLGSTTGTQFDDSAGPANTGQYYWVQATRPGGIASAFSAPVRGYRSGPPATPTGVWASDGTNCGYVRVSWNSSLYATSYKVYRSTSATGTYTQIGTDTASPYDDITATAGTQY